MSNLIKKDIIKYKKELIPFLNDLYSCGDEQQLGCVAKSKTQGPKKPTPKTRKRCPKGTRKNKKTGNCDPISLKTQTPTKPKTPSPKKPTLKTRKRCPKGTRKNKKTGNCDPISLKTQTPTKPKQPHIRLDPPSPQDIIQVRDLLYNIISDAIRSYSPDYYGNKYFSTKSSILIKDKFRDAQQTLRDLVKLTKQEEEYKELIGHSLEYHVKKNIEEVKETPELIFKKAKGMIEETIKDPKKAQDAAFVKTFNELRKKLKDHQLKHGDIDKYSEISSHTLKFYLKSGRSKIKTLKKKIQETDVTTECDMTTICQYAGSCWFVTVFMMLAKIKPLYNLLKQEHKTFVDGLLICPRKDVGSYCKLPPSDIWKLYREKHRKEHSIHQFYKSKENLNLDESFEIGGYSYILFKAIMQINNVYYLSYSKSFHIGYDIVNHINSLLLSRKNACEWLMRNYKKGQSHWTDKIYSNDVLIKKNGLQYSDAFKEITDENGTWPTEETLKKGICYRTTIDFWSNNRAKHLAGKYNQKMRIPELSDVPYREKWKVTRNWLSEVAKKNPDFIGGWFNLKYPKVVEIGGVTHSGHATGYSVCRDDPENPTINICNTWGGTCSQGKHNPWGPGWESKKIILQELQLIQYFPPI